MIHPETWKAIHDGVNGVWAVVFVHGFREVEGFGLSMTGSRAHTLA
jgi:hypothetical protein